MLQKEVTQEVSIGRASLKPCGGVQKPTVIVLNASLVCCIFVLVALLLLSIQGAPYLVIHVCFLLVLAVGLLVLINW